MLYIRVETDGVDTADGAQGTYPDLSRTYIPVACQHCENPACLKVCPVGATYKDDMGRVEIHYDKCIGCGACHDACPWHMPTVNPETGKSSKCIACGACVAGCPSGALSIVDWDAVTSAAQAAYMDL